MIVMIVELILTVAFFLLCFNDQLSGVSSSEVGAFFYFCC